MKNYTIYLIRHGITEGNLQGKYIGLTDLPLCDEGYYAINRYAHDRLYPTVQKVYSSPLKRCLETADIIYPDRYVKQIDNIAECDFGEFEGKTQEESIENLLKGLDDLRDKLEIPKTFKEAGVSEVEFLKQLDEVAEKAFDDQCTGGNPRYPLISEIKAILTKCYYGE